jgi:hypothetical protein
MTADQIERTLHQLDAEAIPAEHPLVPQLERIFGEHTYFLDQKGLNIVEPVEAQDGDGLLGVVVNVAEWTDGSRAGLRPHEPEPTELMVDLETDARH